MIYTAKIKAAGSLSDQWLIEPQYTRVDGKPAPAQNALAACGITPSVGDLVLCAESENAFDHAPFRHFDDNGGACPIIIATYEQLLTLTIDFILKGKMTLGAGTKKMVLGDDLQTWAQKVDASIQALYTWGATGVAPPTGGISPFPGTPLPPVWNTTILSQNHKLD